MGASLNVIGKDTFVSTDSVGVSKEEIPPQFRSRLSAIVAKYPKKKSAVMPALYLAQEHFGWVSSEAISWVSEELDIAPAHVEAVATFYTMYYKRPVGLYHIQLCRTLSCMLCGAKDLAAYIAERTGITPGQITTDGIWSWEEVECLGSCGSAPMVQMNDVFFENLTVETLTQLMDRIEKEKPKLRFSTLEGLLEDGMPDCSRSQVL